MVSNRRNLHSLQAPLSEVGGFCKNWRTTSWKCQPTDLVHNRTVTDRVNGLISPAPTSRLTSRSLFKFLGRILIFSSPSKVGPQTCLCPFLGRYSNSPTAVNSLPSGRRTDKLSCTAIWILDVCVYGCSTSGCVHTHALLIRDFIQQCLQVHACT